MKKFLLFIIIILSGVVSLSTASQVMIIRVENTEQAIEVLLASGITLLKGEQIYTM